MTPEEIAEEVEQRVEELICELVAKKLSRLAGDTDRELEKLVDGSLTLRRLIHEYYEKHAATTVGNRLRCGIYDANAMDRVFDGIWTEQFDRALADRISKRVNAAIDQIIKERLAAIPRSS